MRPDFSKVNFKQKKQNEQSFAEWAKENNIDTSWLTTE